MPSYMVMHYAMRAHQERRGAAREQPPALAVGALAQVDGHLGAMHTAVAY